MQQQQTAVLEARKQAPSEDTAQRLRGALEDTQQAVVETKKVLALQQEALKTLEERVQNAAKFADEQEALDTATEILDDAKALEENVQAMSVEAYGLRTDAEYAYRVAVVYENQVLTEQAHADDTNR